MPEWNNGTRLAANTRQVYFIFNRNDSKIFLESKLLNTHPIVEEALKNFFDQSDKKDFFM